MNFRSTWVQLVGFLIFVLLVLSQASPPVFAQYDTGCSFVGNTQVAAPQGNQSIDTITAGNTVYSFDPESGRIQTATVDGVHTRDSEQVYRVQLENGVAIEGTGRHPVYRGAAYRSPYPDVLTGRKQPDGFEAIQRLQVGDTLYMDKDNATLVPVRVDTITQVTKPVKVYNLTVAGNKTYFAQGIAVHNKTACAISYCGDGTCGGIETCSSCVSDCGTCTGTTPTIAPPPPYLGGCTQSCDSPNCTDCHSTGCDLNCDGGPIADDCPSGCGGHQLCPAPAGQCATLSEGGGTGITVGTCGQGPTCWHDCCTPAANPTPTPPPSSPTPSVGPSPTPGGSPAPTSPPPSPTSPPPPDCGNGNCGPGENCGNCPADCGACPTPTLPPCDPNIWGAWSSCSGSPATMTRQNQCGPIQTAYCTGTIRARAVKVNESDTSCAAIQASTTYVGGTTFFTTPSSAQQLYPTAQAGSAYVSWASALGGNYTLAQIPMPNYIPQRACWTKTPTPPNPYPATGEGFSTTLSIPSDGETLTWDVGYTYGNPWVQVQGADAYAAGSVTSYIASGVIPREFNLDGGGGYPGVVKYGVGYHFDSLGGIDNQLVSSRDWLANQTNASQSYFDVLYQRFGSPKTENTTDAVGSPITKSAMTKPAGGTYYLKGAVTTSSGAWSVGATDKIVVMVDESTPGAGDASLTLSGPITIAPGGFLAFIVNGNISVAPAVGVDCAPSPGVCGSTPVLEGVYVADGTFQTGTSSVATAERLVAKGIFVAGDFLLQRDLDSVGQNTSYAAELFLYNPQLLFTMPEAMKDLPITWEEVAP